MLLKAKPRPPLPKSFSLLENLLPRQVLHCDSSALGITERSISYTHEVCGLLYPHKYVSSLVCDGPVHTGSPKPVLRGLQLCQSLENKSCPASILGFRAAAHHCSTFHTRITGMPKSTIAGIFPCSHRKHHNCALKLQLCTASSALPGKGGKTGPSRN